MQQTATDAVCINIDEMLWDFRVGIYFIVCAPFQHCRAVLLLLLNVQVFRVSQSLARLYEETQQRMSDGQCQRLLDVTSLPLPQPPS